MQERECEALRRENGWLKGLVVGVTQAGGDLNVSAVAGACPTSAEFDPVRCSNSARLCRCPHLAPHLQCVSCGWLEAEARLDCPLRPAILLQMKPDTVVYLGFDGLMRRLSCVLLTRSVPTICTTANRLWPRSSFSSRDGEDRRSVRRRAGRRASPFLHMCDSCCPALLCVRMKPTTRGYYVVRYGVTLWGAGVGHQA